MHVDVPDEKDVQHLTHGKFTDGSVYFSGQIRWCKRGQPAHSFVLDVAGVLVQLGQVYLNILHL